MRTRRTQALPHVQHAYNLAATRGDVCRLRARVWPNCVGIAQIIKVPPFGSLAESTLKGNLVALNEQVLPTD